MANTTSGTVTFDKTFAVDDLIAEAYSLISYCAFLEFLNLIKLSKLWRDSSKKRASQSMIEGQLKLAFD